MSVSIIIPAFNEAAYIKSTIETLMLKIGNEFQFEIIVINNASTDDTALVLSAFKFNKIINLENKVTVAKARNLGAAVAAYETIVFIDADILITQSWVSALKRYIDSPPVFITGSKVQTSINPSWIERCWFEPMKKKSTTGYINSGNLIVKKEIFNTVNGFDESLITGEDVDFSVRVRNKEYGVIDDQEYFVHHEGYPRDLKGFFAREMWHGTGDMKSLSTYFASKIALFSTVTILLFCVASILLFKGAIYASIIVFILWILIHTVFLLYRFNIRNIAHLLALFFLNNMYSLARLLAVFRKRKI